MCRGIIRGLPELILGIIEVLHDDIMKWETEDFGLKFSGYENNDLKVDFGEVIFLARTNNSIRRSEISNLARRMKSNQLIDLLRNYESPFYYKRSVELFT